MAFDVSFSQKQWLLILAVSIVGFLINTDFTAIHLCLPAIAQALKTELSLIQWMISIYAMIWGATILIGGSLADKYGRKLICLTGLAFFILSSAMIAISRSPEIIIMLRGFQGFGGALFIPTMYTLIYMMIPKSKCGYAIGLVSGAIGFGMALGPTLGAFLVESFGWPAIFLLNVPLGLGSFLIIYKVANESRDMDAPDMPILAGLLFGASVMLGLHVVSLALQVNTDSNRIIFESLLALFFVYLFIRRQQKGSLLIPFSIFKNRSFTEVSLLFCIQQYVTVSMLFLMGYYLQYKFGFSLFFSGQCIMALTVTFGLTSPLGGYFADRFDPKYLCKLGFLAILLALLLLIMTIPSLTLFLVILFLLGAGTALSFSSLNGAFLKVVDQKVVAISSSVFNMFALLGNTLAMIITSLLMANRFDTRLKSLLPDDTYTAIDVMEPYNIFQAKLMPILGERFGELGTLLHNSLVDVVFVDLFLIVIALIFLFKNVNQFAVGDNIVFVKR